MTDFSRLPLLEEPRRDTDEIAVVRGDATHRAPLGVAAPAPSSAIPLSDETPQAPGEAAAGDGEAAARDDHVHPEQDLSGIGSEIDELQRVTHDLHAGQTHTGWDEASASEGGLAVTPGHEMQAVDLTAVRAIGTWVTQITSGLDNSNVLVVRIPHGNDLAYYRLIWVPQYVDYLRTYELVGSDDDDDPQWDFYAFDVPIADAARSITLQITGTPEHSGTSTYAGVLTGSAAPGVITKEALSAEVRADIAAGGEFNALTPLVEQDLDVMTGAGQAEALIADFTIANSASIAYVFRVGSHVSYTLGNSLYARRADDPWIVGNAQFFSKAGDDAGNLYRVLTAAVDRRLEIWKVNDLGAIQAVIDQLARPDTDTVWRPVFYVLNDVGSSGTDFHTIQATGTLIGAYRTAQSDGNGVLIDLDLIRVDGSSDRITGAVFGFNPPETLTDEQKLFVAWANLPGTLPTSDIEQVVITRPAELAGGYVSEEARAGDKDPLIENVFDGLTGTTPTEVQVGTVTIESNANVAYLIRVGAATEYTIGTALYVLRDTAPLEIGIANFYSKVGADAGKLYRTLDSETNAPLDIWKVNDLAAIRAVIDATGKTAAQIIADIEGETGDDRLDANALKNLPSPHIIEPLDPLDVDEGDEGDVAVSDKEFFVISTVGNENTFEGILEQWTAGAETYLGTSARATSLGAHGQFTSNHNRDIGLLIAGIGVEDAVDLWIWATAFEAGHGSAPTSSDSVKAVISGDVDGTATTTTSTLAYVTSHEVGDATYYGFAAIDADCVLHSLADGDAWSMLVNKPGGIPLLSHAANEKHFVEYPVKGIDQYAREQVQNALSEMRSEIALSFEQSRYPRDETFTIPQVGVNGVHQFDPIILAATAGPSGHLVAHYYGDVSHFGRAEDLNDGIEGICLEDATTGSIRMLSWGLLGDVPVGPRHTHAELQNSANAPPGNPVYVTDRDNRVRPGGSTDHRNADADMTYWTLNPDESSDGQIYGYCVAWEGATGTNQRGVYSVIFDFRRIPFPSSS